MLEYEGVWVFNGGRSGFPSAVFLDRPSAEDWIRKYGLHGTLTKYPLNCGVYDWVIEKGLFTSNRASQETPAFIANFSSAYMEHYHYGQDETKTD